MKEDYELGKIICKTYNSTIQRGIHCATNENIIVKRLNLEDVSLDLIEREVKILGSIQHDNLMPIKNNFVVNTEVWLIMDEMDFCLKNIIPIKDVKLVSAYSFFILSGLKYLHDQNILHRDIKCGNVLGTKSGAIKLCDFGVSKFFVPKEPMSFVGTPHWMAPEVIYNTGSYDYKADIWSFGITVMEIYFGYPPYVDYKPMKAMLKIWGNKPPNVKKEHCNSKLLSKFINICLQEEPWRRPNASNLLVHKFMKKIKNSIERKEYIKQSLIVRPLLQLY